MFDGDYLEQILGEKYNLKNFYEENEKIIDDPIIEHKETAKETKAKEIIPEIKPQELAINENDIKKESIIKEADIKKFQNESGVKNGTKIQHILRKGIYQGKRP